MQRETKQAPPPLRVDTVRVVLAGTAVWGVALVVLLLLGERVDRLWTWTCLAAIALAGLGLVVMRLQGQWKDPFAPRSHARDEALRKGRSRAVDQRTSKSDVS